MVSAVARTARRITPVAIILPYDMSVEEMRVLQEFRRINAQTLTAEHVATIRHPAAAPGEVHGEALVRRGYLTRSDEGYTLTPAGQQFLAIDAKPAELPPKAPAAAPVEESKA
jgi:hypothetical protein